MIRGDLIRLRGGQDQGRYVVIPRNVNQWMVPLRTIPVVPYSTGEEPFDPVRMFIRTEVYVRRRHYDLDNNIRLPDVFVFSHIQ